MSTQTPTRPAGSILKVLFFTLLLDLVGFSIIFPLYPSMLEHYLAQDADSGSLAILVGALESIGGLLGGDAHVGLPVLFGGVLGSLYSLLQFVCAPILGSVSDRFGRRPVLLVTIAGNAFGYALWFVAGDFWILLVARFIGGVCGANIATASAVVADITPARERSSGMAVIGVAFGMGFILGPLIGGLSTVVDLTAWQPGLAAYGVNPYSTAALVACVLSVANVVWVYTHLPETAPPRAVDSARPKRPINPAVLFRTAGTPGVTTTNWVYFLFIAGFSGVEFSLTFLAAERFGFGAKEIGFLLFFTGLVLAMTQGTYVRRRSPVLGPLRMAKHGLITAVPAMGLVAWAPTPLVLYGAMFLLALATAQTIPMLTALVSLYTPDDEQGRVLGVFRSLGALARAIGPLVACVLFWRIGAAATYYGAAVYMLIPLVLAWCLPAPPRTEPA